MVFYNLVAMTGLAAIFVVPSLAALTTVIAGAVDIGVNSP